MENVARGRSVRPHEPTLQQAVRAFSDVTAALSESPVTDHVLHLIADRICELVGVDRCSIYLRHPKTGLFHGQVGRARGNIDARVKRLVAGTYADGFTHEIVKTRKNVLLTNAQNDPRPIQSTMRKWRVHAMLGVPMVVDDEVVGIAFLDNEGATATFTPLQQEIGAAFAGLAAVVIAKSSTTASLRAELEEAERRTAQWRRARAVEERFDRLLQADAALNDTLREASEISGKPVVLYDVAWRQRGIAQAGGTPQPVPNLGDPTIHQHAAFREALSGLQRSRTCVVEPLPAAGLHQRLLVHAVGTPNDVRGALVIVESGGRFHTLDAHIARRTAVNTAVCLANERRVSASAAVSRTSLIGDLLRGGQSGEGARHTARAIGLDPDARHVLGVLSSTDGVGPPGALDLSRALAGPGLDELTVAAEVADGVLVILPLDPAQGDEAAIDAAIARIERALDAVDAPKAVRAALSSACVDPTGFADAYADALQVRRCMRAFAEGVPRVLAADALGAGRLFVASTNREEAEQFAHRALGALRTDVPGDQALLATLQAFFESARSVGRASERLGIHKNTVRYRLARIEEVTGLTVRTDARDQLTAELALLVLQLRGECPWRVEPESGTGSASGDPEGPEPRTAPES